MSTRYRVLSVVAVTVLLTGWSGTRAAVAVGDAVMEWNQIALDATTTAGQGPLPQGRSMTIVQVAVHDAVNTITKKYDTYLANSLSPSGASAEAAAIAAAHRVLVTLFPPQQAALDLARAASLASRSLTEANPGISVGESTAAAVLQARANDGAAQAQFAFTAPGAGTPGVWTPIGAQVSLLPGWGSLTPWVIRSASQYMPDAPPLLDGERYARDYNEIKEIGSLTSTTRTSEQTEIGRFWLGQPSVIWNYVARQVIAARALDLSDTARTFGLMYLAASDAGITCWDTKYTYNFWRPQVAIRNGHLDGNDATTRDAAWTPLFPTPPHPEYISGHSTVSSAMGTTLGLIFGDDPGITVVAISPTNPGFPRQWATFSQGIDEVVDARVYSGIHWRNSDEVGARVGRQVARFVLTHALKK